MAGLLNFPQGGASGWLGPYLNAGNGSFASTPQENAMRLDMLLAGMGGGVPPGSMAAPASPFENAVPYSPQKMPATLGDTMPQGAPTAPPMAPPTNIGSMPVASVPDSVLPPQARPAQFAPQGAPQAPQASPQMQQGAQLPSFLGGGGDFLDGLKNRIASGLSIMNPQAGQAYMQQQIIRAALPRLLQQTGGDLPKAMAMLQNQKLQEQIYGNPTSLGEMKAGNVSVPVYAQGGKVGYAAGGQGGLGNLIQMGNEAARGNAAAEAAGKVQGTNAANLPQTTGTMDLALKNIDEVLKDPALPNVVGTIAGRVPAIGGHQADLVNKISQLQSQTMLQGFQQLRGAGRITQAEMFKAGEALARLNRVGSVDGFRGALQDLRDVVTAARTRAGVMAGGEPTPPPQQQAAAPSTPSFSQDQLRAEAIRRGLIKQ